MGSALINICDCEKSLESSSVKPRKYKKLKLGETKTLGPRVSFDSKLWLSQVYQSQLKYAQLRIQRPGKGGWGRETWNLCGRLWQPSFLWLIFRGPGGHGPLGPPWICYWRSCGEWEDRIMHLVQDFHETTYCVFGIHLIHFIEKNRNRPHSRNRNRSTNRRCKETLIERRLTRRVFWRLRPGWWGTGTGRSWCRTSLRLLWACASPAASGIGTCRESPEVK